MDCRQCGGKTGVVDSRRYMGTIYRKRTCEACNISFWTVEDEADPEEVKDLHRYLNAEKRASNRRKKQEAANEKRINP